MLFENAVWCAKQLIPISLSGSEERQPVQEEVCSIAVLPLERVLWWPFGGRAVFMPGCRKEPVLLQAVVQIINNLISPREQKQPDAI